jgi:anti-sigma factor RsiW
MSNMSREHWTNDQLIEYLYGLRSDEGHLAGCDECRSRLHELESSRQALEAEWKASDDVPSELLAAQRRRIYQVVDKPQRWWSLAGRPQWASAAVVVVLLAGGATLVEQRHANAPSAPAHQLVKPVSDSELADEVSSIADSSEPNAAAPLEGLFAD